MKSNLTPEDSGQTGVYLLHNAETGEAYIGSGDLWIRHRRHAYELKTGRHSNYKLQRAYNKNPNFDFVGLPLEDRKIALSVEQMLIDEHKENPLLLNLAHDVVAPANGSVRSDITREKMRQSALNYWANPEAKEKSKANWKERIASGYKRSPESMQPSINARKKTTVADGVVYESQVAAAQAHGISPCTVDQRVKSPNFPTWYRQ